MIQHLRLVQLVGFVGLTALATVGCGGDERQPPAPYDGYTTGRADAGASATRGATYPACEDRQVRECRVTLGAQGSVQNCFVGLQLCTSGEWGPCVDPSDLESALKE